jgi:hypothetical protein
MDDFLQALFPQAPSYLTGLLGEEQALAAQKQAQQQGLLGLGLGLLQAAAPAPVRPSFGAGLAQGIASGQQAYQNVFQQRVQEQQLMQQLAEQQRQRQAQQAMQTLLPVAVRGGQLSDEALSLAAGVMKPEDFAKLTTSIKTLQEVREGPKPEYREVGGALYEIARGQPPKLVVDAKGTLTGDYANIALGLFGTANVGALPADAFQRIQAEKLLQDQAKAIQVNLPAEREKKLFGEVDVERVKEFSSAASSSREIANVSESINSLLAGKGGGNVVQIGTNLQRMLGVSSPTVTADDLAKSLAIRAATQVRAPGSGSTSNIEFTAYLQAVPTLSTSQEGRALMAEFSRARATRDAKLADYARKLAREDKYSEEAMMAYDESLGPVMTESMRGKFSTLTAKPSGPVVPGVRDFTTGRQ